MPSFDKLKVSHLDNTKSDKVPVDSIIESKNLHGKHSGRTFRLGGLSVITTVVLPSAEKGRLVSFIVTEANTANVILSAKNSDTIVGDISVIDGYYSHGLVTGTGTAVLSIAGLQGTFSVALTMSLHNLSVYTNTTYLVPNLTGSSVVFVEPTPSVSVSFPNVYSFPVPISATQVQLLSGATVGTKVDLVCLEDGIWTITGQGFGAPMSVAGSGSSGVFSTV